MLRGSSRSTFLHSFWGYQLENGGGMMKKLIVWILILCVFAVGCGRQEKIVRTETPAVTEAENKQEEVVQEMPVVEITPNTLPKPELSESLWNNEVAVQYSREIVGT